MVVSIDRLNEIRDVIGRAFIEKPWGDDPVPLRGLADLTGKSDEYASKLAEHFGVSKEELAIYDALDDYCHRLADGYYLVDSNFPTLEAVAREHGLPVEEFAHWVDDNVESYRESERELESDGFDPFDY